MFALNRMELTITFYNVENLYNTVDDPDVIDEDFTPQGDLAWDEHRYRNKLDRIAEVLFATGSDGLPPAFIGLCEVENAEVVHDLARHPALAKLSYKVVHFESRDVRGIDVAFLCSQSVFEVEGNDVLNFEALSGETFGARDILHVWGRLTQGDETVLHFFINHWPSRHGGERESRHKRLAAAERLRMAVDAILHDEPDAGIVIMGDFNDEPGDYSLNQLLEAGEDPLRPSALFNLGWKPKKRNRGTISHDGEWYLFDSIIVNTRLTGSGFPHIRRNEMYIFDEDDTLFYESRSKHGRPNRTYVGHKYKGGFSDHLAVYCRLSV